MPQMGTSMSEGTVVAWLKQVGDQVELDETICEITTDKVDSECPAPAAGIVREILVAIDETVEVGAVLARIQPANGGDSVRGAGDAAAIHADDADDADEVNEFDKRPRASAAVVGQVGAGHEPSRGALRRYSPIVRRMALEHDVDLSLVSSSGRGGRVTKKDVQAWIDGAVRGNGEPMLHSESPYREDPRPSATAPPVAGERGAASVSAELGGVSEPLSRMRRTIGEAMLRSQHAAATCHTIVECDLTALERRRRDLGLTALPLIARGVIDTLREFQELNATLEGTEITRYERVHLGIAVSLGADGLIVPVIHDAQQLSAEGLASRIKDLAGRARAKRLAPDDVAGATFTITNPGLYGAIVATPVINLPQVAILDVEAVVKRPVVITGADGVDAIAVRSMINLILGWDHRALDGAYAAQFLTALRRRLEADETSART